MNSKIDTIIFDLGGVLVDWDPQYLYEKIFKTQEETDWFLSNVCTPEWNIEQDAGRTIEEAVALKIKEYPKYKEYIELFYERWEEMFAGIIEENVEIQQKLIANNNYRVYALTNWSSETWNKGLKLFPFFNDFEGVVVSGIENTRKPFDEIYRLILDRYQIKAERALFIDDNLDNVNAAIKNGLQAIHFSGEKKLQFLLNNLGINY